MTDTRLTEKDRSIILQVIFKEVHQPDLDPAAVKDRVEALAKAMFQLHDQFRAGGAEELELNKARSSGNRGGGGGGYRKSGGNAGGGGGGGDYTPKYDRSSLPILKLDYFGTGNPISFYDQRPAKDAGAYKPNAADFQSVDKFEGKNIPLWLTDAQGNVNQDTVALLNTHSGGSGTTAAPAEDTSPW